MRHLGRGVVVALAICSGSKAYAVDHLMKINEILRSKNGDTGVQFVELEDAFGESFPNNPYTLEVYDANATLVGSVTLNVPASTTRYLVATAAAEFDTNRDATLNVALPENGQVCFVRGTFKIHCVAWGCLNTVLVGAERAPTPPDNMSVQRQSPSGWQLATPTPDATNTAGTTVANCPTEPDAAPAVDGPPPDAGVNPDAIDEGGDAGTGGNNNNGDDGGGCCEVNGARGAAGSIVLALGVLLALRRRRSAR
jgi:hypothetical protein